MLFSQINIFSFLPPVCGDSRSSEAGTLKGKVYVFFLSDTISISNQFPKICFIHKTELQPQVRLVRSWPAGRSLNHSNYPLTCFIVRLL